MKFIFIIAMLFVITNTFAQDIITKKNGEEIQAKVLNVSDKEINYIKWTNQNGPTYTIPLSEVFMVKYENGEKDIFNKETSITKEQTQTTFSEYGVKQMQQNNLDLLKRQDLLKRAKHCKAWGQGLYWTFLIGGAVGMYFILEPDFETWPTIGCSFGVAVVSLIPMAILSNKANKLEAEANRISVSALPLKKVELGNLSVEPNVNMLSCDLGMTKTLGVGATISF